MKKTIAIIVLLLAVIGAFIFSYQYRNNKISEQISDTSSTSAQATDNTAAVTDSKQQSSNGKRQLIAEDKENDYQLYYDGKNVDIIHGEYTVTCTTWGYSIDSETPEIFCKDYDGDGEKELMIKLVNGKLETVYKKNASPYTYSLYMLKPTTKNNGEKTFAMYIASADTWKTPFEKAINCELTQLKSCSKFLQFAMNDKSETIKYNEKTGITSNKYVGYASALFDVNKKYYTLSRWNRGVGIYDIDKNGDIYLDIQVLANYEETTDTQYIGDIHCEMDVKNGKFDIKPNSIVFKAYENYKVTDPRDSAKSKWNCVIDNESTNTNFKSTDIDWIDAEFSLKNTADKNTMYFETMSSKIKCIDSIQFTQGSVVLTAKKGYTFLQHVAESGKFAVIINSGDKNEYDISYTCSVKTDNQTSTLTIKFDKTYDKEDFDKVAIQFGM